MRFFAFAIFLGIGLSWDHLGTGAVFLLSGIAVLIGAAGDPVD